MAAKPTRLDQRRRRPRASRAAPRRAACPDRRSHAEASGASRRLGIAKNEAVTASTGVSSSLVSTAAAGWPSACTGAASSSRRSRTSSSAVTTSGSFETAGALERAGVVVDRRDHVATSSANTGRELLGSGPAHERRGRRAPRAPRREPQTAEPVDVRERTIAYSSPAAATASSARPFGRRNGWALSGSAAGTDTQHEPPVVPPACAASIASSTEPWFAQNERLRVRLATPPIRCTSVWHARQHLGEIVGVSRSHAPRPWRPARGAARLLRGGEPSRAPHHARAAADTTAVPDDARRSRHHHRHAAQASRGGRAKMPHGRRGADRDAPPERVRARSTGGRAWRAVDIGGGAPPSTTARRRSPRSRPSTTRRIGSESSRPTTRRSPGSRSSPLLGLVRRRGAPGARDRGPVRRRLAAAVDDRADRRRARCAEAIQATPPPAVIARVRGDVRHR